MPSKNSSKHWVVTGGAGFIGSEVVRLLVRQKQRVTVLDNFSTSSPENLKEMKGKIKIIRGSILDEKQLKKAFRGADYVLHLAAIASVAQSFQNPTEVFHVNWQGTACVLEQARKAQVKRVLFISSSSVYGMGGKNAQKETSRTKVLSPYALTKLLGEDLCQFYHNVYGLETITVRCFNIYGSAQPANSAYAAVLAKWSALLKKNKSISINGDGLQTRDFLHVTDTARAIVLAAKKGKSGEVYNIASGKSITLLQVVKLFEELTGRQIDLKFLNAREGDVRYSCGYIGKLKKLGFTPKVPLKIGLAELLKSR